MKVLVRCAAQLEVDSIFPEGSTHVVHFAVLLDSLI
jgi:hypothetical protein